MSEQIRVEFESWYESNRCHIGKINTGCYPNRDTRMLFEAWQASRQSLVVKLPELFNATFCDAYEADAMKEALDDAGVRYE